jgi:hypothetical protein
MIQLGSAEPEIQTALERMNAKPESSKPFVVITVKHEGRKRFVQFYGSSEKGINLDLPTGQFNLGDRLTLATERVAGAFGHVLHETEHGYGFEGCTAAQGAVWAVAIFKALGFPPSAVVELEEHADRTGIA